MSTPSARRQPQQAEQPQAQAPKAEEETLKAYVLLKVPAREFNGMHVPGGIVAVEGTVKPSDFVETRRSPPGFMWEAQNKVLQWLMEFSSAMRGRQ